MCVALYPPPEVGGFTVTGDKTIYKSVGEFGETKYSQFAPETGSKAQVIEMRSDGQPSQPGLLAPISSDQISEDLTGNNQNPPVPTSKSGGGSKSRLEKNRLRN